MIHSRKTLGTIAYMGGVMTLPEPFTYSWGELIQYNYEYFVDNGSSIFYDRVTASYHSFARNTMVQRMRGKWLLMLDTDIAFDPDIAVRMVKKMEKYDVDVLTGVYQYKFPPYSPVLYRYDKKSKTNQPIGKWDKNVELFEVGSAGAGCLMVKREVFDRIKKELKEDPFDIAHPLSEDHSFFHRLKKLKIQAYCDPSIEIKHLTLKFVGMDDYHIDDMMLSRKYRVYGKGKRGGE